MPGHHLIVRATAALAFAANLFASGCAGDGVTTDSGGGQFATIQREVFNPSCVQASCHDSGSRQGGLDLSAGDSYGNLVEIEPQNPAARAAGLLRVDPTEPENSFLLRKLTGELTAGEGAEMPLGSARLAPARIELVRSWIEAGAPLD